MRLRIRLVVAFLCLSLLNAAGTRVAAQLPTDPRFETLVLSEEFHSEGAAIADLNSDGHADIVSGPYYYLGPDFRRRVLYADEGNFNIKQYSEHFFSFAHDFNEDGHLDILSIPIPGGDAIWFENPGQVEANWGSHLALPRVGNESPTLADLTGDGIPELVAIQDGEFGFANWDQERPQEPWKFQPVTQGRQLGKFTHGLGLGDVNGDGRQDLLESTGWWEQGESGDFLYHPQKFSNSGGAQMFAYDFDGDGDQDILSVQNAHGYGLSWFERRGTDRDFLFVEHSILGADSEQNEYGLALSQMHAVALADIDQDGVQDIVTGKRYFAHGGSDAGAFQPPLLLWLRTVRSETRGVTFEPHIVHARVGVGTQVTVGDVDANGQVDIVVGNKLGTFVALNRGVSGQALPKTDQPLSLIGTDAFAVHVRETEPLTPQQELQTFQLPPGFEAQLVASEPQIAKPMNLAFDAKGRLWVTSSSEYPYPAPADRPGRDTIQVLEDRDGDGTAESVTTFAEDLNIPIGLYPYLDGVICFSIPNILFLRDTDGDGKADQREVLFGPMDTSRDTHGMCNGFTRAFDGWLYACHGFNNRSQVSGQDGHQVVMNSGNTFRMRLDGSRIEHFTHGQVNPFGLCFDSTGDAFTADCHSKPVTLLMRDGYYPSFGKPHDGLGFVPNVLEHLHGSTGIGGIAIYRDTRFPRAYQGSVFGGNVMTGRVNRNSLQTNDASVRAVEESDFLVSGDPWFRPVDIQLGPDGALYVADFYNRIIGHYEVPLDHPGRDRQRGRIWRIVYTGRSGSQASGEAKALTVDREGGGNRPENTPTLAESACDSLESALAALSDSNLKRRLLATNILADRYGRESQEPARELLRSGTTTARIQAAWLLHRLGTLDAKELEALLTEEDPMLRNHGFRILAETKAEPGFVIATIEAGLRDENSLLLRAALMASIQHPRQAHLERLLELAEKPSSRNTHLRHALRMALREHLSQQEWFLEATENLKREHRLAILDVCLAIPTGFSANFVLENLGLVADDEAERLEEFIAFAAHHAGTEGIEEIERLAGKHYGDDLPKQETLLRSALDGYRSRLGTRSIPKPLQNWAQQIVSERLGLQGAATESPALLNDLPFAWTFQALSSTDLQENCWVPSRKRSSSDGQQASLLFSSFPRGEQRVGIYQSQSFVMPQEFFFYMAGHDGYPDQPIQQKNWVRLRDGLTREILHQWSPPRNDVAQRFSVSDAPYAGREVYLELVDGDDAGAYAWLAVGRFSVERLNPSNQIEQIRLAVSLIEDFDLRGFRPTLLGLLAYSGLDAQTAIRVGEALVATGPAESKAIHRAIAQGLATTQKSMQTQGLGGENVEMRQRILQHLEMPLSDPLPLMCDVFRTCDQAEQTRLAELLVSDGPGAALLLNACETGAVAARVLQKPAVRARLDAVLDAESRKRLQELLETVPDLDSQQQRQMVSRRSLLERRVGDAAQGAMVFKDKCGICHQIGQAGKAVGPNLDGIGNRGLSRLVEDVFLPSQNVDVAFRASVVLTDDDRVLVGLARELEDGQLVLVDSSGKETKLGADQIASKKQVFQSPMPANFLESLSAEESADLFAFLLGLTH